MSTRTTEEIKIGPLGIRFLVEGEASGGTVAVFECDVPAGAKVPAAHSHDAYEETIYGLRGVMTWTVEGTTTEVGPGDVVCIPRGAVHRFDNLDAGDARALVTLTPAVAGKRYFEDIAAVVNAGGPPDMAKVKAVMDKCGLIAA
jgi:quercetin dioxygenase-like cupin family protein